MTKNDIFMKYGVSAVARVEDALHDNGVRFSNNKKAVACIGALASIIYDAEEERDHYKGIVNRLVPEHIEYGEPRELARQLDELRKENKRLRERVKREHALVEEYRNVWRETVGTDCIVITKKEWDERIAPFFEMRNKK